MSYEGLPVAQKQVYWVAKSGNDTNSGLSVDDAFLTWDAACAAVAAQTPSVTNQFVINCEDAGIYAGPSAQVPDYCSINGPSCTFTTGIIGGAFSVMNIGIINITSGIGYSVNSSAETSVNIGTIVLTSGATGVSAVTAIINGFIGAIYDTDSTGTGILINDSSIISFATGSISCGTAINQSAGTLNLTCTTLVGTNTFTGGIQSLISAALISGPTLDLSHVENVLTEVHGGTNQSTYAKGDILFASAANTLSKLTAAADGTVLTLASGVPSWAAGSYTAGNFPDGWFFSTTPYSFGGGTEIERLSCLDSTNSILLTTNFNSSLQTRAQSPALAGTVAVSGTTAVVGTGTSFTTNFIVGDVIYIAGSITDGRRITVVGSNTSLTVESIWSGTASGQTYYRGGYAPNTMYCPYIVGTGGSSIGGAVINMSTRNVYLGDTLPLSDITYNGPYYRQLPWNECTPMYGGYNWGYGSASFSDEIITLLSGGTATTVTAVTNPNLIPYNATSITVAMTLVAGTGVTTIAFGNTNLVTMGSAPALTTVYSVITIPLFQPDATTIPYNQFRYKLTNAGTAGSVTLNLLSYEFAQIS